MEQCYCACHAPAARDSDDYVEPCSVCKKKRCPRVVAHEKEKKK